MLTPATILLALALVVLPQHARAQPTCTCANLGVSADCPYCGYDDFQKGLCYWVTSETDYSTCGATYCHRCPAGYHTTHGCFTMFDTRCSPCVTMCGVGYYAAGCPDAYGYGGSGCKPCTNAGIADPSAFRYTSAGASDGICTWTCNDGYGGPTCQPCARGFYRQGLGRGVCSPCPELTAESVGIYNYACDPGTSYRLSKTDPKCRVLSTAKTDCDPCQNALVAGNYYVRLTDAASPYNGLVSTAQGVCYQTSCCTACTAGKYPSGCAGSSGGACASCVDPLPGYYYDTKSCTVDDPRSCVAKPCTACATGKYNPGCVIGSPGECTACFGLPSNADYVQNNGWPCYWKCNDGFYNDHEMYGPCNQCLTSAACDIGYYMPKCSGGFLINKCSLCTGRPAADAMSTYTDHGNALTYANDCPWGCIIGYYRVGYLCLQCAPSSPCAVGYYPDGACYYNAGAADPPTCKPCTLPDNAWFFTGSGQQGGDSRSCPFVCNAGFFRADASCTACRTTCPSIDIRPFGFTLTACTATSDAQCVGCPASVIDETILQSFQVHPVFTSTPASCSVFHCSGSSAAQVTTDKNGVKACTLCPAGSSKADYSSEESCVQCDQTHYAPSPGVQCLSVPTNAASSDDRTRWACNAGYYSVAAGGSTSASCAQCSVRNASIAVSLAYAAPNNCTLAGWLCSDGYFRDFAVASVGTRGTCSSCASAAYAVANSSPDDRAADLANCPTCLSQPNKMEYVNAECPIQCNAGFYYSQAGGSALTTRPSCVQCLPLTCATGYLLQLCFNGLQINNTCYACANALNTGQIYDPNMPGQCVKICKAGYYKLSTDACQKCNYGWYKPTTGNSACLGCPDGKYSATLGSTACPLCSKGHYCSGQLCTVQCAVCDKGKFTAVSGSSACQPCSESSIATAVGSSGCTECPLLTPFASAARTACALPSPPCPAGFFQPAAACVPCLTGAYCPGGSAPPVKCPYGTPYSPRVAKTLSDCAVLPSTIPTAYKATTVCPANTRALVSNAAINSTLQCESLPGYYAALSLADQSTTLFGTQCPVDYYCAGYGCTMPVPCPPSAVFAAAGSSDASQCTPTMTFPCRGGFYKYEGYDVFPWQTPYCTECPVGFVCPGGDTPPSMCADVSSKYWSPPRSTSAAACTFDPGYDVLASPAPCPQNSLSPLALDGSRPNAVISYLQCRTSAGYFEWGYDFQSMDLPYLCPVGYYCPKAGTTFLPIPCPALTTQCLLGQYTIPEGRCPARGFATPGTGCAACPLLPVNAFFIVAGDCAFCCAAGFFLDYYYNSDTYTLEPLCMPAPGWQDAGCTLSQYVPATPACATASPDCADCPAPQLTMAFPTRLAERPSAACAYICAPGHYNNNSGGGPCTPCPAGTIKPLAGNATLSGGCTTCGWGLAAASPGSTECAECPMHSLASADRSACLCMAGTQLQGGACAPCPAGYTSQAGGLCQYCGGGSVCVAGAPEYVPSFQKGWDPPCPAGSFASNAQASCDPCPPGTFSPADNSVACTMCGVGTSSSAWGATACVVCDTIGIYSFTLGATAC